MANIIPISLRPAVFHPGFVARLAEANRALRQLRELGCKAVSLRLSRAPDVPVMIVVDRNPHRLLVGCPGVHVTHGRKA